MQKFLLGLVLVTSLAADFNDREGEEFETSFGTVCRSSNKLVVRTLEEGDIKIYTADKKGLLVFKGGSSVGGVVFGRSLVLSQKMKRSQFLQALAEYIE